jgi:uracil-DNA glycosylase
MNPSTCIACPKFPCDDVNHECFLAPDAEINPDQVKLIMIAEAAPAAAEDYFYADGDPLFAQTTIKAFQGAGVEVGTVQEILDLGVYLTTAVKCGKTGYGVKAATIKECSVLLEAELALFPKASVLMLMGDVAIKAVNQIARRAGQKRVIPAGSTYKIRGGEFSFQGRRLFPSYLQAGPSFFIEKSKRTMIAADIAQALAMVC